MPELTKFQKAKRQDDESHGDPSENNGAENLSNDLKAGNMPWRSSWGGCRARADRAQIWGYCNWGDNMYPMLGLHKWERETKCMEHTPIPEKYARLPNLEKRRENSGSQH